MIKRKSKEKITRKQWINEFPVCIRNGVYDLDITEKIAKASWYLVKTFLTRQKKNIKEKLISADDGDYYKISASQVKLLLK